MSREVVYFFEDCRPATFINALRQFDSFSIDEALLYRPFAERRHNCNPFDGDVRRMQWVLSATQEVSEEHHHLSTCHR